MSKKRIIPYMEVVIRKKDSVKLLKIIVENEYVIRALENTLKPTYIKYRKKTIREGAKHYQIELNSGPLSEAEIYGVVLTSYVYWSNFDTFNKKQ